jgi:hypothetical protein
MKRAPILMFALCAGCGLGLDPPTNNGLLGTWTAPQPNGTVTMVLQPGGPHGVFGTATDLLNTSAGQSVNTYTISTLPDESLLWTLIAGDDRGVPTADFKVKIAATCLGEPLPEVGRVHFIDLFNLGTPGSSATRFERSGPAPTCSTGLGPP